MAVAPKPATAVGSGEAGASSTGRAVAVESREQLASSGAVALRRVTSLLSCARRADSKGDYQRARELYLEVLKVRGALAPASLATTGCSLQDATAGVEARLAALELELGEGETVPVPTGSRPATMSSSCILLWDTASIPECSLSAREGCNGRPATRDRPCTQDGLRRVGTADCRHPLGLDGAPDVFHDARHYQPLEGMQPSTPDGARLQQLIDGTRRGGNKQRPHTRDGLRDRARKEMAVRQASSSSSRRKRHQLHTPEVLSLEAATRSPSPSLSPCVDADESAELLE